MADNILLLTIVLAALVSASAGHPIVPSLDTIYDFEKISTNMKLFQRKVVETSTTTTPMTTETTPLPMTTADLLESTEKPTSQVRIPVADQLIMFDKIRSSKKSSKQKSDVENMSENLRKYVRL